MCKGVHSWFPVSIRNCSKDVFDSLHEVRALEGLRIDRLIFRKKFSVGRWLPKRRQIRPKMDSWQFKTNQAACKENL